MKRLIAILQLFSIGLGLLSLILIVFSLTTLSFDSSIGLADSIDNIYNALSKYSGSYKFTFIVCAFWATLRQLEISQGNYTTTLKQVKFVQEDVIDNRKKVINNETLKQCNFFLNELQVSFKELIETNIVSGMPLNWKHLQTFTKTSLEKNYPTLFERIQAIERPKKNQILITLY